MRFKLKTCPNKRPEFTYLIRAYGGVFLHIKFLGQPARQHFYEIQLRTVGFEGQKHSQLSMSHKYVLYVYGIAV
jgi:hypothetical protein